ncbi:MAG: class I SAM-dependent RNA methyltransferase [Gemmatimonas sp.]|nr:class I SAM-dependent RNA methyltransferase [Gemmatimonas sp.]
MEGRDTATTFFAVTAPGLEELVAAELRDLDIAGVVERGGVSWSGPLGTMYLASLHLRTASRILVRVSEFKARSFIELERHLRRIDWTPFVGSSGGVRLRVTSRKSRLYHQGAIEERFAREIGGALGMEVGTSGGRRDDEDDSSDAENEAQLFVVRFHRDRCLVSADSSGALLHRRGYRRAVARAPLRETLAAAVLLASGWTPDQPLLDPLCGSGTIPIEGALLARRIPPPMANPTHAPRGFAFQHWPDFDPSFWDRIVGAARAAIRHDAPAALLGSDRDAGAIEAAWGNARRAGVEADVHFDTRPLSAIEATPTKGWLISNPPYGVRVGERRDLRNLYASLGNLFRSRLSDWNTALIAADDSLLREVGGPFAEVLRTRNGGIPVKVVVGRPGSR